MLNASNQQKISQYVDDTSFIVHGDHQSFPNMVNILKKFGIISGLKIDWDKNMVDQCNKNVKEPLDWVCFFGWKWAKEKDLSKPLGTPFGLNLDIVDVDSFFISKIKKKFS